MDDFNESLEENVEDKKISADIYKDLLQPATQEIGKFVARVPRAINAALSKFDVWIERKEFNVKETKKLLEKKLENVNPENIVTPESYVGVPALQAISYSMDSEELRNLYANLLATSMIQDIKWKVHPSYVEVIKQITPDEAKLLKILSCDQKSYPLIDVKIEHHNGGYNVRVHNFTTLAVDVCENLSNTYSYLDNLARLKIIEIPFGVRILNDEIYKPLEEYSEIKELLAQPLPEGDKWEIERKKFDITDYGRGFIETCVKDIDS